MEKYFKVKEASKYHEQCITWRKNMDLACDVFNELSGLFHIKAKQFLPSLNTLGIIPAGDDNDALDAHLRKPEANGSRLFRKDSPELQWWINAIKERNIGTLFKPYVPRWFEDRLDGHYTYRIFEMKDGEWYGSFAADCPFVIPDGLIEMMASEWESATKEEGEV